MTERYFFISQEIEVFDSLEALAGQAEAWFVLREENYVFDAAGREYVLDADEGGTGDRVIVAKTGVAPRFPFEAALLIEFLRHGGGRKPPGWLIKRRKRDTPRAVRRLKTLLQQLDAEHAG